MDKTIHQIRCEQWSSIINECLASGINKTAWCRQNGISDKAFFYWQRLLRKETYPASTLPDKELPELSKKQVPELAFAELRTSAPVCQAAPFRPNLMVRKGDVVLEISNSISPELFSKLGGLMDAQ